MRAPSLAVAMVILVMEVGLLVPGCGDNPRVNLEGRSGPLLVAPAQGEPTGSVWSERALAPEFRWTEVPGASHYEVQVDDSCASPIECSFPSPETVASPRETFLTAAGLAVSTERPVGRRYFWRVRACLAEECTNWSATRYVDVGRQRQDFNGDGYGDLAISAVRPESGGGGVFVYFGGSAPSSVPGWIVRPDGPSTAFAYVAWIGDMDGDGYADLATVTVPQEISVRIFRGGPSPDLAPIVDVLVEDDARFAFLTQMVPAFDLNGDGFSDLYFQSGVSGRDGGGTDHVLLGEASLQALTRQHLQIAALTSYTQTALCDFDNDGYSDLIQTMYPSSPLIVKGAPLFRPSEGSRSALATSGPYYVRLCIRNLHGRGSATLVSSYAMHPADFPLRLLSSAAPNDTQKCDGDLTQVSPNIQDPIVSAAGDTDGDGFTDLLVGDADNNRAFLFFGGCPVQRFLELPGGHTHPRPYAGNPVGSPGDMNGDGFDDFAVGNTYPGIDSLGPGEVSLYLGGPTIDPTPTLVLTHPDNPLFEGFGAFLD